MRVVLAASIVLGACGPPVQPSADASIAPAPDAAPVGRPDHGDRWGRAAAVHGDRVYWAVETGGCCHDCNWPCYPAGPAVMHAALDGSNPVVVTANLYGASSLAVDGDEIFAVVSEDDFTWHLIRYDGELQATVFASVRHGVPLALDADHIYWSMDGMIVRATRSGDGSDVIVVADPPVDADHLVIDGGMIYAASISGTAGLWRVAVDGSDLTPLLMGSIGGFTVRDGVVYAGRSLPNASRSIVALHPDGTLETVVAGLAGWTSELTVDGDSLFWVEAGNLHRVTIGTDDTEVLATGNASVYAVSMDAILLDFGEQGFNTLPR